MHRLLREKILKSAKLLKVFGVISQLCFFLLFRRRVKGNKNRIEISKNSILINGSLLIKGDHNHLIIKDTNRLRHVKIEIFGNNNEITLNDSVLFYEKGWLCIEGDNCKILIGSRTTLGSADIFCGENNTKVEIGSDCMFSRDIVLNTSDFHSIIEQKSGQRINPPKDIRIGDHVWIGNGVSIMKGASIGNDSIIAMKALVSGKTYSNNSILAGLPAKVIKENVTWSLKKLPY